VSDDVAHNAQDQLRGRGSAALLCEAPP
jgi:hypothetical protein